MILKSHDPVELGKARRGTLCDGEGLEHPGVWMMPLRRATRAEYVAWCEETGCDPGFETPFYYEVSVD